MDPIIANALDFFSQAKRPDLPSPGEVLGAMSLSFVLNLLIGALYKATYKGTRYSQDYVHTLVIIGTVTTILIMVVLNEILRKSRVPME